MDFWQWFGVALLVWVIYDLYSGSTWVLKEYKRSESPMEYWLAVTVWAVIALTLTLGLW